jgi:hypothetical protein
MEKQFEFEVLINRTPVVGTCDYTTKSIDESFDHDFGTENCYIEEVDDIDNIDAYIYVGDGEEAPYTGDLSVLKQLIIDQINEKLF